MAISYKLPFLECFANENKTSKINHLEKQGVEWIVWRRTPFVLEWVGESSREIFVLVKGLMKK